MLGLQLTGWAELRGDHLSSLQTVPLEEARVAD